MPIAKIPDVSGGLNTDMPAWELPPNVWTSVENIRFPPGRIENWKGAQLFINPTADPQSMFAYANATNKFIGYASTTKIYAFNENVEYDITRFTEGVTISSITRVGTTATLTTSSNHGRTTGDTVSVWGALPSQYNGTYVITVATPTTFTYTMASDPGASASPVGQYTYNAVNNFTYGASVSGDRVTFSSIGNVLFANHQTNGLYWWDGRIAGSDIRLRIVPGSSVADCSRVYKNFIIQLATTESGTKYKDRVRWGKSFATNEIPSTFTPASSNDAGYVDLSTTPGNVIDCKPLGDLNVIFKSDSIWLQQYIQGDAVFSFNMVWGNDGLLWRDQVVDIGKGLVYITSDYDVKLFNGSSSESIADGVILNQFRADMASWGPKSVIPIKDPVNSEIIFSFGPFAYVWNWVSSKWTKFSFSGGSVKGCTGDVPPYWTSTYTHNLGSKVILGNAYGIGAVPVGSQTARSFFGSAISCEFRKSYFDVSQIDKNAFAKNVELQRSCWNFDIDAILSTATIQLKHGSSTRAGGTQTLTSAKTYTISVDDFADIRSKEGQYLYLENVMGGQKDFSLRSILIDYKIGGDR